MKPILLSLALIPLLLTGCATSGYYSDYPGYYGPDYYSYYGPGYYDGPGIGIGFYDRGGYYRHDYHHEDRSFHHGSSFASTRSFHGTSHFSSASRVAGVRSGGHSSHAGRSTSASTHR